MTDAQADLVVAHMELARLMGLRWARRWGKLHDREDFIQTAYEGLCIAADKFDPARGVPFERMACVWMGCYLKKMTSQIRRFPDLYEYDWFADFWTTDEESDGAFWRAFRAASELDREVLVRHVIGDESFGSIAKTLGMNHPSDARRSFLRAVERLRGSADFERLKEETR